MLTHLRARGGAVAIAAVTLVLTLALALRLATVSVLHVAIGSGQRTASLERPTRKENAMFGRTSFALVAALGALLLAAPASADNWGADLNDDAVTTSEPAWARALRLRSEALNRQYGLGAWVQGEPRAARRRARLAARVAPSERGAQPAVQARRARAEVVSPPYDEPQARPLEAAGPSFVRGRSAL
jgi:hypothetical protein